MPVVPYITVTDAPAAIAFYKAVFGATEPMPPMLAKDGKRVLHARLAIEDGMVMLSSDFPEFEGGRAPERFGGSPVTIHVDVDDADATAAKATKHGATIVMPVADQFWGGRYGQFRDPYGHYWSVQTKGTDQTAA